jgi:glycosyltransferase involved in cell wall biosynthesis
VMDVFVLASWREGMPRSAIEAAAMGRPMVLTDIRGCREVARQDREALLVPPRDPQALAAAISRLAADSALRQRLGAAARRRALERFSEAQVAERVVGHYRRLFAQRSRGRLDRRSPFQVAGSLGSAPLTTTRARRRRPCR